MSRVVQPKAAASNGNVSPEAATAQVRLLETCCAQLESELARQARVLEACKEQGRAARAGDIPALERATRALAALLHEGIRAEGDRLAVMARLSTAFGLGADTKLSALAVRAPEQFRNRLLRVQLGLKETLAATRRLLESNGRFLREGARTADRILNDVFGAVAQAAEYNAEGQRPGRAEGSPALLNVAG